jgi:hypothetical protein
LLGPGNIDVAELLVRMQFAICSSTSELDMTLTSETDTLNKASDGSVEDEEEPEVIVENEDLEVTIEDDDEASADGEETEKAVEDEELTSVSSEDPDEKDAEDGERNVNDVASQETHDYAKWNDLIEQEERQQEVIFIVFLHLELLISFKFQDVQYYD